MHQYCHSGLSGIFLEQPPLSPFSKGESERFPIRLRRRDDKTSRDYLFHLKGVFVPKKRAVINSSRGFTLLEVLVATAIMGIAVAVVLQLFSANLRALALSADFVSAATRAEVKMREILHDYNFSETASSETTNDGYRFDVAVTETQQERTENLQVKLLEIVLTVHWVHGAKEKSLTLRTLKTVSKADTMFEENFD